MFKTVFLFLIILLSSTCIANEQVIQVLPLNNRLASDIQSIIAPLLENSEKVIIANNSSLIIKASSTRQRELKKLINQLDKHVSNLIITVIQSKTQTAHELNASAKIRLGYPKSSTRLQGHFANTENLADSNNYQQIRTLDGKSAYIQTGKIHPIDNTQAYLPIDNNRPLVSNNRQFIKATTGFLVTPRLSGQQVVLEVKPWSNKMNINGTLSTQSGHSTIRLNLGQWVEIGGINQHNQQSSNGLLSHSYSTTRKSMKILIKVDITR